MSKYEMVVLGFLSDKPAYGYQINREVRIHRMDSWANIQPPMIYKTLTNFEKEGMVNKVKVERAGLMPERSIYRLTSKGKKRLAGLIEKSLTDDNLTSDLSNLGYFFIHGLSKKEARDCLKKREDFLGSVIREIQERLEALGKKTPVNVLLVVEKDLDRFKSELSHLKKLAKAFG